MAKKILAVVLAVMIAVSAMAITAFAEDAKIPVYPVTSWNSGVASSNTNADTTTINWTFDIPVWGQFGYMDSNHYMVLTLPTNFGGDHADNIKWAVIVNGESFGLEDVAPNGVTNELQYDNPAAYELFGANTDSDKGVEGKVSEHKVSFGFATHSYNSYTGDTTIPQSTSFNNYTSIRLVATIKLKGNFNQWYDPSSLNAYNGKSIINVQWYNADDTRVEGSVSFLKDWNASKSIASNDVSYGKYVFITDDWTTDWLGTVPDSFTGVWGPSWTAKPSQHPLAWDHTLGNKATIYGASSDTVKFVVELDNPIVGSATYTLWASTDIRTQANWWTYDGGRKYVSEVKVDGEAKTLEFDVPLSVLYDADKYGTYNQEFVIFENITLLNTTIMKSYLRFDAGWGDNYAVNLGKYSDKNLGKLKWGWDNKVQYMTADGSYKQVRYAAGGATEVFDESGNYVATTDADNNGIDDVYPNYAGIPNSWNDETNLGNKTPAKAVAMYLLIPQEDTTEVDNPKQSTENNEENEDVDDTEAAPEVDATEDEPAEQAPAEQAPADNNPTTGVALAVLPMIISAAAAVISKKH